MAKTIWAWGEKVNKLLTRLSDVVNAITRSWADDAPSVDFKEIDRMRNKLTKMRFAKPTMEFEIPLQAVADVEPLACGSLRNNFSNLSLRERDRQSIRKWFTGSEPIDVESKIRQSIDDMTKTRQRQEEAANEQWQFHGVHEEYPRIGCRPIDLDAEEAVAKFLSSPSPNTSEDITPSERRITSNEQFEDQLCEQVNDQAHGPSQLPAVVESFAVSEDNYGFAEPVFSAEPNQFAPVDETPSTLAGSLNNKVVPLRTSLKSINHWRQKK